MTVSTRAKAIAVAALFLSAAWIMAQELNPGLDYVDKSAEGQSQVNWTQQTVRAVGNGAGPETIKDLARRKILAKRAAVLDAYRNLLEAVKGVRVTSSTLVQDLMLQNDTIKAETEGMVKGAQETAVNYTKDGICEVTLEVHLDQLGEYLLSALNEKAAQSKDEYPQFDWTALQKELDQTKSDLNATQGKLQASKSDLNATQATLARTNQDLEAARKQAQETTAKFELAQAQLSETNTRLVQTESKLNSTELRAAELQQSVDSTKAELQATAGILDGLKAELATQRVAATVGEKELAQAKEFLAEKGKELDALSAELATYKAGTSPKTELQSVIEQVKEIQAEAQTQVADIIATPIPGARPDVPPAGEPADLAYTGLLIDARGLGAKPALAPAFLNTKGFKLFGLAASYLKGALSQAIRVSKAGINPLVVKASQAVKGSDLVLADNDIKKVAAVRHRIKAGRISILF
jgi:hypothetical protein